MKAFHLGYRPALDGLRGIAVLAVMGYHFSVPGFGVGLLGVDVFFVLSGFLITGLLLDEWDGRSTVDLSLFYGRRLLRLFPALLALLVCTLPFVRPQYTLAALFYATNWTVALGRLAPMPLLNHLWSLSIEEQFYLLWPPLLLLALKRVPHRWLAAPVFALACLSALWRAVLWHGGASWLRATYGTDVRADGLLIGCALALLTSSGAIYRRPAYRQLLRLAALVPMLALIAAMRFGGLYDAMAYVGFAAAALITAAMIGWTVVFPLPLAVRLFSWRPLVSAGRISYGLYLWHVPAYILVDRTLAGWPLLPTIAAKAALALTLAALSYAAIEQPALRLKARLRARAPAARDAGQA